MAELIQFPLREEANLDCDARESDRLTFEATGIMENKRYKAACLFAKAIKLNPMNEMAIINLGACSMASKRLGKAELCFRQAILINPKNPRAHYNLGYVLEEQNYYDKARDAYLRALKLDPSFADAHFNLGFLYSRALNEPRKALQHFDRYAKISKRADAEGCALVREEKRKIIASDKLKLQLVS